MAKRDSGKTHDGHRQRLKNQFRAGGLDSLDEYRVLELILFYAIPLRDTNPLAHTLIDRFGSLAGVFDAGYDELMSIDGVGENVATLIKLIPASASYYLTRGSGEKKKYDTAEAIGEMLVNLYIGIPVETVFLLLFNNKYELIDTIKVHEGSVNSVSITPRKLIEPALLRHAPMAVLAHNHPGGVPIPSSEDINTSCVIKDAFDLVGITLLEHFVVAGNRYSPILIRSLGLLRARSSDSEKFYSQSVLKDLGSTK